MTVLEVIQRSTAFLQGKGVDSPRLQVELMLAEVLNVPRLKLYLNFDRVLAESELNRLRAMVTGRGAREPLQHILGTTSFCGLEIKCSPAALIPRPETELLAERGWQFLANRTSEPPTALELGTGTGCIAIALAVQVPRATIHSVDISTDALALARENAARHHVQERIHFHHSDGFQGIPSGTCFDLVISNPPYIPRDEIATLSPEVRDFDPKAALDGGIDGLEFYRRIASDGVTLLKPGGRLMIEFGDGQESELQNLFSAEKWIVEEIVPDYSSRPRILIAKRSE